MPLDRLDECECAPRPGDIPDVFLEYERFGEDGGLLLARFEDERWRTDELGEHILEWLLDFALPRDQRLKLAVGNSRKMERRATKSVFGELRTHNAVGEILLHIACRQVARSMLVIPKVWFKTASGDEVKGFDGVHAVHGENGLELWLGEAKFYKSMSGGAHSAARSLAKALEHSYLRGEMLVVAPRIEDLAPHKAELQALMDENTPIMDIVSRIVIPILIVGDSNALSGGIGEGPETEAALIAEHRHLRDLIRRNVGDVEVQMRFFTVPLDAKEALVAAVDRRVAIWR